MGNYRFFLGVAFTSISTLAYEILLTRIFSIALWYHFAFMIVSIAMFGLAGSGTFLTIFHRFREKDKLIFYAFFSL